MEYYDEIFIEGIKCYSIIGINNWEKNTKQPLIIDINLLMKNNASKIQIENAKEYFKNKKINNQSVIEFLNLKDFK